MSIFRIAVYSSDFRWFTAVMATITVASISQWYGYEKVSPYFFIAGLIVFLSVAIFMVMRVMLFYREVKNEVFDPEKTLYFFTIVSAVNFIGVCLSKIFHFYAAATIFWYVAIGLWLAISLSSFSILFLYQKSEDRKIEDILHGGWFFAVVGTQSTAFLGVIVAEHAVRHIVFIQLFSFVLWSVGASLYLIFATIIIFRLIFFKLSSNTGISPYWMNAGAAALTALTGAVLHQHIQSIGGPLDDFLPFLRGISLFFWAVGLWWLPFLVILTMRKQAYGDEGMLFTVGYWEIAFTLGLCSSGTIQLVHLFERQYLAITSVCFCIAFMVFWCFSSIFTIAHFIKSSVWVPVNDLTIDYVVPYSFTQRGRVFKINKVIHEWLDQTIQGILRKRYCVITTNNLTCQISYDMVTKKWHFDRVVE